MQTRFFYNFDYTKTLTKLIKQNRYLILHTDTYYIDQSKITYISNAALYQYYYIVSSHLRKIVVKNKYHNICFKF